MSSVDQAHNDAERGVAEAVYAVELPPPMTASEGPTRVNSTLDLKDSAVPALPDVPPPPLTAADEKVVIDEKKGEVSVVVKKEAATPGAKKPAPPKPKWKRASRWVRFKLWYNTYR